MANIIDMPRLSDTMTEGVVAAWHVKVGDKVSNGDLLAEVETDKATMDVESFFDGTVLHLGIEAGNGIPVGSLLAIVGAEGEDVSGIIEEFKAKAAAAEAEEKAAAPSAEPVAKAPEAKPVAVAQPVAAPVVSESSVDGDGRLKASPLAKKIAQEKGIDLSLVAGSGDHGRIIKRDVENFQMPVASAAGSGASIVLPQVVGEESFEEVRVSQMRKTIARRLSESKFSAPHFYITMEIHMDKAVEARKAINEISPVKVSFNDMIIRACATALRRHPAVNASWQEDTIRYAQHVHVGMAVAVEEGLLVPVIRFADNKGLATIAAETKELAGKARSKKLQPAEWEGNTFTVSNLGMFGVEDFTAIINPPDACILAIGGINDKAVVRDGQVVPGKVMKVTLSCDHRVVDGAKGSEFLVTLKQLLEDPVRMLI